MSDGLHRRDFIKTIAGASFAPYLMGRLRASGAGANRDLPPGKIYYEPFNYGGVRLRDGMFKKQYDAARDYYFAIPDDDILRGFRLRAKMPAPGNELGGWNSFDPYEHLGQWMSVMARMYRIGNDRPMLDKALRLMSGWAETLERGRYFAQCRWPAKPHYAFDKTAQGLIDLCEYGGRKEALPLLEKITDWSFENLDRSRKLPVPEDRDASATEWYTVSENMYRAFRMTGDSRYRKFGDLWRYPAYWRTFSTAAPAAEGLHAYSHVNTLGSAAMDYGLTGDPASLRALIDAYDYFQRTQCYATGGFGPGENLMPPDGSLGRLLETEGDSFETPCGSWAVFKFTRQLMGFTGEARFGDWMERILYNGIGAALPPGPKGQTFYYSDYRLAGGRKAYHPDAYPCCSGSYPLAVAEYHNLIYFKDAESLYVNLFVPSEVVWNKAGEDIWIVQETDYPEAETTTLTIRANRAIPFALKFRAPSWCRGAEVKVNGSETDVSARPGTWGVIQRTWKPGDRVEIRIPMRIVLAPIDAQHPRRVAVIRGPVALVRKYESSLKAGGEDPSKWIVPGDGPLEFRALQQSEGTFVPFYRMGRDVPYLMYMDLI
jgi:uncharacterized protein